MKQIKIDRNLLEIELTDDNKHLFTSVIAQTFNVTFKLNVGKKIRCVLIKNFWNQIKRRIDKEFIDKQ